MPGGGGIIPPQKKGKKYGKYGYVSGWVKLADQFYKLFEKYGLVFEMYNYWNRNTYEI